MKKDPDGVLVIYSRKSRFTGKGESVENQVEMCRSYIGSIYGPKAADTALVYEDEGFSGGNLQRPRFQQMMKDSKTQKFSAIVVYRLDRISRNIGDFAGLIQDLSTRNIDFISIREQFDTASPMGRAMMYIASVFSQLERETIAERIRDNMRELAKTGRWLGGNTPAGYESEAVSKVSLDGKVRKAYQLKAIPEEIALIRKIFDLFLETGSLTGVDRYLLERQVRTRRGGNFTRFAIREILTNPVYMIADEDAYHYMVKNKTDLFAEASDFDGVHGIMAYNRTLQRPGKTNQRNAMDQWIVSVGRHRGIIPGAVWITVQQKLERNKSRVCRSSGNSGALLSGLLHCGSCGNCMRPKLTNRKNAEGELIYHYMCTMKERSRSKICRMKNISGNQLDAAVAEEIGKLGWDSEEITRHITQVRRMIRGELEDRNAERNRIRTEVTENEEQIRNLVDTLSRTVGTSAERCIVERIEELNRVGEGCRRHLQEMEQQMKKKELPAEDLKSILGMLTDWGKSFPHYSPEQKREVVRQSIQQVTWDGEKICLYFIGRENLSHDVYENNENPGSLDGPLREDCK